MAEGAPRIATAVEAVGQLRQTRQDLESSAEKEHAILEELIRRAVELQERLRRIQIMIEHPQGLGEQETFI